MHQTLTTTGKWSGCRARAPARTVGAGAPQTCPARSPSVTSRAGPARAPRQSKSGPLGQCNLAYRQPRDELALPLTPSPTIGPGHIDSPSASQPRNGLNSAPNHGPGPIPPFTTRRRQPTLSPASSYHARMDGWQPQPYQVSPHRPPVASDQLCNGMQSMQARELAQPQPQQEASKARG